MNDGSKPINDPNYWKTRLMKARKARKDHQAIYMCTTDVWKTIEAKHREILERVILPHESILDVGCGWGRLLNLLPTNWRSDYLGIDLSPDFIDLAMIEYPDHNFICGRAGEVIPQVESQLKDYTGGKKFDWCIFISIKDMILENQSAEEWTKMETTCRSVANRLLILEYNPNDEGSVE